jgi:hypothetical protein
MRRRINVLRAMGDGRRLAFGHPLKVLWVLLCFWAVAVIAMLPSLVLPEHASANLIVVQSTQVIAALLAAWLYAGVYTHFLVIFRTGRAPITSMFPDVQMTAAILIVSLVIAGFWRFVQIILEQAMFLGAKWYQGHVLQSLNGSFTFDLQYFVYHLALFPLMILHLVAGAFVLSRLAFAPILVADRRLGPMAALWESIVLTRGYTIAMSLFFVAAHVLVFVSSILLFIGWVFSAAIVLFSLLTMYQQLKCARIDDGGAQERSPMDWRPDDEQELAN